MRKLVQEFGDSQAAMVTPAAVEAWLQSHGWSKGTRNRYLATMMFTYKLGVRNKAIGANPLVGIKWASERDRKRIRFLTDIEETRLREVILPEHLAEFIFALNSGLRLSEQFGLRWEDVAVDLSYVTLRHTKNGSIRHARLNSVARAILETRRQASGLIFSGRYTWKWFPKAVEAAGLNTGRDALDKITWHTLRHTFASRLVMAGVPLKTVSNLLGHSSITVTERYAHLAPQHEADAVEMLVKPTDTRTDTAAVKSLRVN